MKNVFKYVAIVIILVGGLWGAKTVVGLQKELEEVKGELKTRTHEILSYKRELDEAEVVKATIVSHLEELGKKTHNLEAEVKSLTEQNGVLEDTNKELRLENVNLKK